MNWVSVVGVFAAAITCAQFLPQTLKTWQQRNDASALSGIAVPTFLMVLVSATSWVIYGFGRVDYAIVVPNSVCLLAVLLTLGVVQRSRMRAKVLA